MMPADEPGVFIPAGECWTLFRAALVMGVSPQRVRQLAAEKKIIASKVGRDWLVDQQAAREWRNRSADGNRRGSRADA
jgi:hypothetical protein